MGFLAHLTHRAKRVYAVMNCQSLLALSLSVDSVPGRMVDDREFMQHIAPISHIDVKQMSGHCDLYSENGCVFLFVHLCDYKLYPSAINFNILHMYVSRYHIAP